jgi:dihydroorotate dehydrogenase electron transfer subunit
LWRWLDQRPPEPGTMVFTCGPEPMMHALAVGCAERKLRCQVAMERQMACGMGTCQSCVCQTKADNEAGWAYKLVCTDGPVFEADQLLWDAPGAKHARREEHGKSF